MSLYFHIINLIYPGAVDSGSRDNAVVSLVGWAANALKSFLQSSSPPSSVRPIAAAPVAHKHELAVFAAFALCLVDKLLDLTDSVQSEVCINYFSLFAFSGNICV